MTPHEDPRLEQFIDRALRELPDRRAPRALEARVMAAIAARKATPWWRASFDRWPVAVRVAFLLVAGGFAFWFTHVGASVEVPAGHAGDSAGGLDGLRAVCGALYSAGAAVARSIPRGWFYGALSVVALMYAGLFGLGATAYRSFILKN